jgi:hypothetical protein
MLAGSPEPGFSRFSENGHGYGFAEPGKSVSLRFVT